MVQQMLYWRGQSTDDEPNNYLDAKLYTVYVSDQNSTLGRVYVEGEFDKRTDVGTIS